jgi:hypothetical protein
MLPGYMAEARQMEPYYSPIYVRSIAPLKTGKGLLRLQFLNACYASGVADFDLKLRVLARRYHFLIVAIEGNEERCAIISEISFPWVKKFCPHLIEWRPPSRVPEDAQGDVSDWLSYAFL